MNLIEKVSIAKELITKAQRANHFISVEFVKKTTGELRKMTCHRAKVLEASVKSIPDASTLKRKATNASRNNLSVEEITADGSHQWRTIPLENIVSITSGNEKKIFN